jgi:hypothetical protein
MEEENEKKKGLCQLPARTETNFATKMNPVQHYGVGGQTDGRLGR